MGLGLVAGIYKITRCGIQRYRRQNDWVSSIRSVFMHLLSHLSKCFLVNINISRCPESRHLKFSSFCSISLKYLLVNSYYLGLVLRVKRKSWSANTIIKWGNISFASKIVKWKFQTASCSHTEFSVWVWSTSAFSLFLFYNFLGNHIGAQNYSLSSIDKMKKNSKFFGKFIWNALEFILSSRELSFVKKANERRGYLPRAL